MLDFLHLVLSCWNSHPVVQFQRETVWYLPTKCDSVSHDIGSDCDDDSYQSGDVGPILNLVSHYGVVAKGLR